MEKEGNITPPNWPVDEYAKKSPIPSSNSGIPARTLIKPFAGLPASTGPKPMAIEKGQVTGTN